MTIAKSGHKRHGRVHWPHESSFYLRCAGSPEGGVLATTSRGVVALALSPLVVLLASGTRLLVISNYDTNTASTMATSGGLGETLLGTVIPLLPFFLPAAAAALAIFRMWLLATFTIFAAAIISPAYATVSEG